MSPHQICLYFTLLLISPLLFAAIAEKPIEGGLGVKFNAQQTDDVLGSELNPPPTAILPDNQARLDLTITIPGQPRPWRYHLHPSIPRMFRDLPAQTYVMLDEEQRAMRVHTAISYSGCGDEIDWLTNTIAQKYDVKGDMEITAPAPSEKAFRVTFAGKQIDVRCGPELIIDYANYRAIKPWIARQKVRLNKYQRELAEVKKRRLVLERRRAIRFADEFTLGDRFRLMGAFGIPFNQPFAEKSTKNFPVDRPFIVALPNLPEAFATGEITIEIAPNRYPIVIRGRFEGLEFERLTDALAAKYGTALKASPRHVIHKIAGNHAIVKKFADNTVELAFIDTAAQTDQRNRRWEQESEGV